MVKKGNIPWNKNLTKKTDKRLKNCGNHNRKGLCLNTGRTHFKKGETPWNKNLKLDKEKYPNVGFQRGHKCFEGAEKGWFTTERVKGDKNIGRTPKERKRRRLLRQQQILMYGRTPNIGKNEKQFLDEIELSNNIKLIRQYPIKGYWIDGYCKKLNLAIEIDEKHHQKEKQKQKDKMKDQIIKKELNCTIIRIPDNFNREVMHATKI